MRARYPEQDGYVERDGVKVFYEVFGDGAPTILLMPTWSIVHSRHWKMQVPFLARNYRVITFDPQGQGDLWVAPGSVYTASVDSHAGCSFAWTIDGQSPAAFASGGSADDARLARLSGDGNGKLEFRALDNLCHTIQATATCTDGNETCTGIASTTAKQCVSSTPGCK